MYPGKTTIVKTGRLSKQTIICIVVIVSIISIIPILLFFLITNLTTEPNTTESPKNQTTTTKSFCECPEPKWVSDGFCDDSTNNQKCNYDGGDCCGNDVDKTYCFDCHDCLGMYY